MEVRMVGDEKHKKEHETTLKHKNALLRWMCNKKQKQSSHIRSDIRQGCWCVVFNFSDLILDFIL